MYLACQIPQEIFAISTVNKKRCLFHLVQFVDGELTFPIQI